MHKLNKGMVEKKALEEIYFYFFDGDVGLNVKNIIAYYNETLLIDSFSITIEGLSKVELFEYLKTLDFKPMSQHENLNNKHNKFHENSVDYIFDDSNNYYTSANHEAILNITNTNKKSYDVSCYYVKDYEPMLQVKEKLEKFCRKHDNRIQIITKKQHGYDIEAIDVKKIKIDFDKYYNETFNVDELTAAIESDETGLIILSGVPGSGKSSLVKYLVRQLDKEFCYLPSTNIDIFSDPSSLPFIIQELNNKVLVLEDCEKLLKSRDDGGNGDVATILNISDGILGDYLNLKMIVTLNKTEHIDDALLRKGRLLYSYEFGKLAKDKANALAEELGHGTPFTEDVPLTDVINFSKKNGAETFKPKRKKIGF